MQYLLGYSFQSVAADLKQSSGRARVLGGGLAPEHHARTGQARPVEDLDTWVTRYETVTEAANRASTQCETEGQGSKGKINWKCISFFKKVRSFEDLLNQFNRCFYPHVQIYFYFYSYDDSELI